MIKITLHKYSTHYYFNTLQTDSKTAPLAQETVEI